MKKLLAPLAISALTLLWQATDSHASPGYALVCFDREFVATVDFDLEWTTASMKNNWGEFELKASEGQGGPDNSFAFEDSTYRLVGIMPEGEIKRGDQTVARCWQPADNQKTLALYGSPENQGRWSSYDARGTGSGNVRQRPSIVSEKIDSLGDGEPVIIKQNTDEFLDGFFWYQIEYGEGQQGYIWGALLCTNDENLELSATIRRCN